MNKLILLASLMLAKSVFAACPVGTEARGVLENKTLCALKGKYLSTDIVLTSDNAYVLEDGVFFGGDNKDNATLRIQAGTKIHGAPAAFLAILRGSKLYAEGTKENPIVFTSLKLTGQKRGDWGGLVLNGNAPINACNGTVPVCEAVSEGIKVEPVKFGGNNPEDSSGVLKYVRIEYGGYPISQDNELNGISFNGVGQNTEVDYVQVHMNADDGVEFFGGSVNVKHLVLTANEDDSLDWDMGWTGKVQYLIVDQGQDVVDNGIEADNLKSPMNASPRSMPEISNMTFIGSPKSAYGLLLRRGTGAIISNAIVTGFSKACIDIDDAETFKNGGVSSGASVQAVGIKMNHTILNCAKSFEEENGDLWSINTWFQGQEGNLEADPQLNVWVPKSLSPAIGKGVTPEDLYFEPVDFIGAIGSDKDNWTLNWTTK